MGSKTFDGVWFTSYSDDHPPQHVHGRYAGVRVVVDLMPHGKVRKSNRWDAVVPSNAKRSDIRHVLDVSAAHADELKKLWETTHGPAS